MVSPATSLASKNKSANICIALLVIPVIRLNSGRPLAERNEPLMYWMQCMAPTNSKIFAIESTFAHFSPKRMVHISGASAAAKTNIGDVDFAAIDIVFRYICPVRSLSCEIFDSSVSDTSYSADCNNCINIW